MKVLVLGADGMFGHEMVRTLVASGHDVVAATRRIADAQVKASLSGAQLFNNVDARLPDSIVDVVRIARPEAVVNAIGIVKQRPEASDAVESIRVNSLFPHLLKSICQVVGARLVHVSTDCVFSGHAGAYTEDDIPDPVDLYGRSKLLGEVIGPGSLTFRTSIVGLELCRSDSLVEWFLRQTGTVAGWRQVMYSGFTTAEFSRIVLRTLEQWPELDGLWHVSSEPISKYDFLAFLRDTLSRDIHLNADDTVTIDRTLDSRRFRAETGYQPPSWDEMLNELAEAVREREDGEAATRV